ncbi:MAG: carboxypeptidase-like regulatory domain-containing protein [Tissierellia bacterium]|nr:carboxypeptidase-like regulatory domain-containing protein [Tissierellia bacterium]
MTKFYVILCILIFIPSLSVHSQSKISGLVKNIEDHPIEYVSIRLLKESDSTFIKGTASDSLGNFSLTNIDNGSYLLHFSSIGYSNKTISLDVITHDVVIEPVILISETKILDELVVTRKSLIRTQDKILIFPDKQQVKFSRTGFELLYNLMIPGITIDRESGNISTFGGNATLYIDGQKSDYRRIQSLRPQDIERVEYYDAPTGKYSNDIVSINFITKNRDGGGYISIDGKYTFGYDNKESNIVGKILKKSTSFTVWGGLNKKEDIESSKNNETIQFKNHLLHLDKESDNKSENNSKYLQFEVSNKSQKLNNRFRLSLVENKMPYNTQSGQTKYSYPQNIENKYKSNSESYGLMPNFDFYSEYQFKENQQLEIYLSGIYSKNNYKREYLENQFLSKTNIDEKFYSVNFNVNYFINLKNNNSFASQFYNNYKWSKNNFSGDNATIQKLYHNESILFLDYNKRVGNISYRIHPGGSVLSYRLSGEDKITSISPRLNLRFIYQPRQNQQIQTNVDIGNTYPNISNLRNIDQVIDSLNIKRGNPNLEVSKLYKFGVSYNVQMGKVNLYTAISYFLLTNPMNLYYYIVNEKLINSYISEGSFRNLNSMLAANWNINNKLRMNSHLMYTDNKLVNSIPIQKSSWSYGTQVNYFLDRWHFNLYINSGQNILDMSSVIIKVPFHYGVNVSWNNDNLSLQVGVNNIFEKNNIYRYNYNSDIYIFNTEKNVRSNQQSIYFKLNYSLNFGKKIDRVNVDIKKEVDSTILKVD